MTWIYGAGTVVLAVAALAGLVFLVLYTTLAQWWKSREGWYLAGSSLILATILAYNYAALMRWFDLTDPAVRDWTRLVIYTGALVIMVWRGLLLIWAQAEMWQGARRNRADARAGWLDYKNGHPPSA